jgi:hypothetical protein
MTDIEKAEYEDVLRRLTAQCEELVAENARLRSSENNAHAVLGEVYNDPTASPAVRVKAAGLALPHETPRLAPVAPAIDATAEEIIPLADLVRRRRARQAALEGLDHTDPANAAKFLEWVDRDHTDVPPGSDRRNGNGQDDDTAAS